MVSTLSTIRNCERMVKLMEKLTLKSLIPPHFILFIVSRENDICRTYINIDEEQLTFHQVLRKVKIYPYSKKHKGVIHIIATAGLDGKYYVVNNYELGSIYENGTTKGYA